MGSWISRFNDKVKNMKNRFPLLLALLFLLIGKQGFSQETQNLEIKLTDRTVESKLSYATWRIDYYICTGIAYAKSLGMTVDDFAAFVASKHSITRDLRFTR